MRPKVTEDCGAKSVFVQKNSFLNILINISYNSLEFSLPLWKVALFLNFQIPYKIVLITNKRRRRFLGWRQENWYRKTEAQFGTKGSDKSADERGLKCNHTNLALGQFRKQWSIVSILKHEAQREDGIYPQFRRESRTLTACSVISHARSFL